MVQACFVLHDCVLHDFIRHHLQDEGDDLKYIVLEGVPNSMPDDGQDDVVDNVDVHIRDSRDKIAEMTQVALCVLAIRCNSQYTVKKDTRTIQIGS